MKMHGRILRNTTLFAMPLLTQAAAAQPTITIAHSEQGRVNLSFVDNYGMPRDVDIDIDHGTNPTTGGPPCVADLDDGSFTGTPDGGVTIDDLIYFLYAFEMGFACADLDDGSFTGTPDDGLTIDDLLYFIDRFELGC
jgi:hypothetical protein